MTYNYKKIKTIQKCLFNNKVPEDLFDIIFDYYGDTEESIDDLHNKHCFYQINCSSIVKRTRGYFCSVCNNFLEVKSVKQLSRHCKCVEHRQNLLDYNECLTKKISIQEIKIICATKWFRGMNMKRIPQKFKKNFIDDLFPIPIVIDFNQNKLSILK